MTTFAVDRGNGDGQAAVIEAELFYVNDDGSLVFTDENGRCRLAIAATTWLTCGIAKLKPLISDGVDADVAAE